MVILKSFLILTLKHILNKKRTYNKKLFDKLFLFTNFNYSFFARYIAASMAFINYNENSEIVFKQILYDNTFILLALSGITLIISIFCFIRYLKKMNKYHLYS